MKDKFISLKITFWCFVIALIAAALAGCASINQTVRTEIRQTNGIVEVRETHSKVIALWDSNQTIDKLKVTNGKTQTIGVDGIDGNASSTNIVAGLEAMARIVQGLK